MSVTWVSLSWEGEERLDLKEVVVMDGGRFRNMSRDLQI